MIYSTGRTNLGIFSADDSLFKACARREDTYTKGGPAAAGYSECGTAFYRRPRESPSRACHFAEFTIMLGTGRIRGNYSRYFRSRTFLLAAASVQPRLCGTHRVCVWRVGGVRWPANSDAHYLRRRLVRRERKVKSRSSECE